MKSLAFNLGFSLIAIMIEFMLFQMARVIIGPQIGLPPISEKELKTSLVIPGLLVLIATPALMVDGASSK